MKYFLCRITGISFTALIVLIFSLAGCSADSGSGPNERDWTDGSSFEVVQSIGDLPECDSISINMIFFLSDSSRFLFCDGTEFLSLEIRGADGRDGVDGEKGERGESGADGKDGTDGKDGVDGNHGATGPRGEKGEQGEQGTDGDHGPTGPQGEQGSVGPAGADGTDCTGRVIEGVGIEVSCGGAVVDTLWNDTNTPPVALEVKILLPSVGERTVTGEYLYFDFEEDPENGTLYCWLRNGAKIPGATEITYTLQDEDAGTELRFVVVPKSGSLPTQQGSAETSAGILLPAPSWCLTTDNCGTFADTRNDKIYKWTKIGDQIWMAENLNFGTRVDGLSDQKDATASSAEKYCYGDDDANCDTYGGLYQWHSVMALSYSCNENSGCTVNSPHRGICPEGWHIPTQEEWGTLDTWVDNDNGGAIEDAGKSLKSATGWSGNENGTNGYGWNALPGGVRYSGSFHNQSNYGYWWSASEHDADYAWNRHLFYDDDNLRESGLLKSYGGFSVRCLKD